MIALIHPYFSGMGTFPFGNSVLSGSSGVSMDLGFSLSCGERNLCLGLTGGKLPSGRIKVSQLLRSHFPGNSLHGIKTIGVLLRNSGKHHSDYWVHYHCNGLCNQHLSWIENRLQNEENHQSW